MATRANKQRSICTIQNIPLERRDEHNSSANRVRDIIREQLHRRAEIVTRGTVVINHDPLGPKYTEFRSKLFEAVRQAARDGHFGTGLQKAELVLSLETVTV